MSKNPVISSTKEYTSFKRFDENREVNKNHLRKLVQSIKQKNLLYLFPIVVNAQREIIDGQHRLAAAQLMEVPVYFIIDNNVNKADIAMVNNNRKGWSAMDYVLFYAKQNFQPYQDLRKLLKFYPLPIILGAKLMTRDNFTYTGGGSNTAEIRSGRYLGGDYSTAKKVCEVGASVRDLIPFVWSAYFMMEIKKAIVKQKLSTEVVINLLSENSAKIVSQEEFEGLPMLLRGIFNPR